MDTLTTEVAARHAPEDTTNLAAVTVIALDALLATTAHMLRPPTSPAPPATTAPTYPQRIKHVQGYYFHAIFQIIIMIFSFHYL